MHSTLRVSTSNSAFNSGSQWEKQYKLQAFKQNPCFRRILKPSNSLKTSFDFDFEEEKLKKELDPTTPTRLPVVIRQSDGVSRYFWDGNDLKLVSVDGKPFSLCNFSDLGDGFRRLFRSCSLGVRNFLLPREIDENYLEYVKWKFLHRVFSSALQVLATQAMFRAIGIGYARSLPSAAALNWVLKDGLGRLSRCIYTASLASAFDTNLKRVRFSTSVIFSLSIGVELMTPAFPQYFLLLASIANIAKQISLACYIATSSAVHRSFALADNLGEVSAKAQIQTVCFDNLGLMLAAALNIMLKNHQRLQAGLPFLVYPIFTAVDLYGIYQSLKHVHLQTLTKVLDHECNMTILDYKSKKKKEVNGVSLQTEKSRTKNDRLEMIIDTWIHLGCVPSPAEVSKCEGIDLFSNKGRIKWPIRIGCLNPRGQIPKLSMMAMQSLSNDDFYFVSMEVCGYGFPKAESCQGIVLCLREGASTADIIMGLLQACYVREGLRRNREDILEECDWFKLVDECKQSAKGDMKVLNEKMVGLGWACKNILLSTDEQTRFSFIDN